MLNTGLTEDEQIWLIQKICDNLTALTESSDTSGDDLSKVSIDKYDNTINTGVMGIQIMWLICAKENLQFDVDQID